MLMVQSENGYIASPPGLTRIPRIPDFITSFCIHNLIRRLDRSEALTIRLMERLLPGGNSRPTELRGTLRFLRTPELPFIFLRILPGNFPREARCFGRAQVPPNYRQPGSRRFTKLALERITSRYCDNWRVSGQSSLAGCRTSLC